LELWKVIFVDPSIDLDRIHFLAFMPGHISIWYCGKPPLLQGKRGIPNTPETIWNLLKEDKDG
jgi:hypothetical protein